LPCSAPPGRPSRRGSIRPVEKGVAWILIFVKRLRELSVRVLSRDGRRRRRDRARRDEPGIG
jgi:hypothetical protein